MDASTAPLKPSRIGVIAVYLAITAVVFRTLVVAEMRPLLPRFLGSELVYLILFTVVLWKFRLPTWLMHLYLIVQSLLILGLISLRPSFDFAVVLVIPLSYQASLYFTGRMRMIWVSILVLLTGGSLMYYQGALRGLAMALTNMAAVIVVPAYVVVNQEIEAARAKSQALLSELQDTHQQLESYISQAGELAAIQERNRLARELHDTVSQLIFSINLTTGAAQLLLKKESTRLPEQLNRLQEMTTDALSQLRALITELRPPQQT